MNQKLLCLQDSEQVKYLGRDLKTKKLIGFCSKCITTAQVPFQRLEDVENDIEINKSVLMKVMEDEKDENIVILHRLLDFLNKFKNEQAQKLDQLILNIQQEILFIQKSSASKSEKIKNFNNLDLDELKILFQQNDFQKEMEKQKEQILIQLSDLQSKTFLFESSNTLCQFPSLKQFQQFKESTSQNQSQGLKCKNHNQEVIAIDLNVQNQEEKLLCLKCIAEKPRQVMTIEDADKIWNDHHQQLQQAYIKYQQQLQQTISNLQNHISKCLDEIKIKLEQASILLGKLMNSKAKFIEQQIRIIKNKQLDYCSHADIDKIIEISKNPQNKMLVCFKEQMNQIDSIVKTYQTSKTKTIDLKNLFQIIVIVQKILKGDQIGQELNKQTQNIFIEPNNVSNLCETNKNLTHLFEYKKLPESFIYQDGYCYTIAINTDGDVLAVRCDEKISIYEFKLGELKLLQQLDNSDTVYCLQFIKNQNTLVSGGSDAKIKIWISLLGSWKLNQTLSGHTNRINCLATNSKGNQIISGSADCSIKFWSLENKNWSNFMTILNHKSCIYNLSLNGSQNQLLSCDEEGLVLVTVQTDEKLWSVIQQLKLGKGFRLCFLTNNQFSFQPAKSQQLCIFEFNKNQQQFIKIKEVQMKEDYKFQECASLFPQQFVTKKQILINKYKNHLNIVKRLENGEFKVEQSIKMKSNQFNGTMSDDGEYLFLTQYFSKQIKVYKYDEIRITEN